MVTGGHYPIRLLDRVNLAEIAYMPASGRTTYDMLSNYPNRIRPIYGVGGGWGEVNQ